MDIKSRIWDFCEHPRHTKWIAPILVLGDAFLCALIIWKIPCKSTRVLQYIPSN